MSNINYLFAVEAEKLLQSGKFSEAVQYCKDGISRFPDYPLGYGILARSYIESGEYAEAAKILTNAIQKFPNNKSLLNIKKYFDQKVNESKLLQADKQDFSISQIEDISEKFDDESVNILDSGINSSYFLRKIQHKDNEQLSYEMKASNLSLIPGILDYTPLYIKTYPIKLINYIAPLPDMPEYPKFLQESSNEPEQFDIKKMSLYAPIDDIFTQLASQIENTIMPEQSEISHNDLSADFSKSSMVSETIAQIYIHQKAFDAAINVYKKLAVQEPEKVDYFNDKIDEIIKIKNEFYK